MLSLIESQIEVEEEMLTKLVESKRQDLIARLARENITKTIKKLRKDHENYNATARKKNDHNRYTDRVIRHAEKALCGYEAYSY